MKEMWRHHSSRLWLGDCSSLLVSLAVRKSIIRWTTKFWKTCNHCWTPRRASLWVFAYSNSITWLTAGRGCKRDVEFSHRGNPCLQTVPRLMMAQFIVFPTLQLCKNQYAFHRNCTSNFELSLLFPRLATFNMAFF